MSNWTGGNGCVAMLKHMAKSLKATRRPWRVFLDLTALGLPLPLSTSTARISRNLNFFAFNYLILALGAVLLSVASRPIVLLFFVLVYTGWVIMFFSQDEETSNDKVILIALIGLTVALLFWSSVWGRLLIGLSITSFVVVVHALLRSTADLADDLDRATATYDNLLSDEDYDSLRERVVAQGDNGMARLVRASDRRREPL